MQQLMSQVVSTLARQLSGTALQSALSAIFKPFLDVAIAVAVIRIIGWILDHWPQPVLEGLGSAQRYTIRTNEIRRAAYVINAIPRIEADIKLQRSRGVEILQAIDAAKSRELSYFQQHVTASNQRMQAANKIDALAGKYGNVLGWYARNDKRTTAECRAANGKNFSASFPPLIGWPGMVHVHCRCYPGKPHRGARMLATQEGLA